METANYIIRRVFAWPTIAVGVSLMAIGGMLIKGCRVDD